MPNITISDDAVEFWTKEIDSLEREIREKQAKIELLRRRIAAIPLFASDLPPIAFGEVDPPPQRASSLPDALPDAIRLVVADRWLSRQAILAQLMGGGFPEAKLGSANSYFYTVIRRLLRQGELRRRGELVTAKKKAAESMT